MISFRQGDRFLEACGLNRDWPSGRGIFHNDAKTFLVWVNEEDQLRIISMQDGADIGAVFERLSRAATAIEKVARFAHNDHIGYITSCPTNLGTALRASVHIKLPLLAAQKERFEKIAAEFNVPVAAYHVSGEYAMLKAAVAAGAFDEEAIVLETLTSIRRAGASILLTYHAKDVARWLA